MGGRGPESEPRSRAGVWLAANLGRACQTFPQITLHLFHPPSSPSLANTPSPRRPTRPQQHPMLSARPMEPVAVAIPASLSGTPSDPRLHSPISPALHSAPILDPSRLHSQPHLSPLGTHQPPEVHVQSPSPNATQPEFASMPSPNSSQSPVKPVPQDKVSRSFLFPYLPLAIFSVPSRTTIPHNLSSAPSLLIVCTHPTPV